MNAIVQDR